MKKTINYMLLMLLGLMSWSCSDSNSSSGATEMRIFREGVDITDLEFSVGAGSKMVGVFCDGEWDAALSEESWCTISNHAGSVVRDSTQYIKVSVEKNTGEARSVVLTVTSGGLSRSLTITQKGTGTDPGDTFISSYSILEQFKIGYNLGNTLDSNPHGDWWDPTGKTPTDWEQGWGQPITTPEIINAIAEKGFNVIRIPVTWKPHMDGDGNVDPAWMARVKEVVDMVLSANCYCIVNVQHDTGADATAWLQANMETYPTSSPLFKKLWTQIANTFKDYGENLLFEAFNEILYTNSNDGWNAPSAGSTNYEAIRRLHQDFVDAVRATGGNNEYRNLVINPYAGGNSEVVLNEMAVPNDKHANHLLLSVHSYDPYNFCNDNGEWNVYYFDDDCRSQIDALFQRVNKCSNNLGIPAFFGEFGAIDEGKDMSERTKYAAYLRQKFAEYNTTGLWWMGLIKRNTLEWYESEIVDALFN